MTTVLKSNEKTRQNTYKLLSSSAAHLLLLTSASKSCFPGCIEHTSVIWEQIQRAKREKIEFHMVWLDLANTYGSVPHKLVEFALEFFPVPGVCNYHHSQVF